MTQLRVKAASPTLSNQNSSLVWALLAGADSPSQTFPPVLRHSTFLTAVERRYMEILLRYSNGDSSSFVTNIKLIYRFIMK